MEKVEPVGAKGGLSCGTDKLWIGRQIKRIIHYTVRTQYGRPKVTNQLANTGG